MKREQLREFTNAAAVLVSIGAMTVSILEFKGFGDGFFSPMLLGLVASAYAAVISIYFSRMKEKRLRQRRIFIMYSHADSEHAKKLVESLREAGYNPWYDQDEIAPGQRISETVANGIAQSAVALLLVSKNLDLQKEVINRELKAALSTMRSHDETFSPVIPIRLDETDVPESLSGVHWLSMKDDAFLERLDKGLKRVLGA